MNGDGANERNDVVVRRAERGWVVGEENVSDLTSAMVLADLFAADHADGDDPGSPPAAGHGDATATATATPAHRGHGDATGTPAHRGHGDTAAPSASASPGGRPAANARAATPTVAPATATPATATPPGLPGERAEAERLAVTVTQLEHALASRVGVEQAIGILAERHRLRPREAFDLLRKASRSRGRRVTELAHDVVESTANPLLLLPDELARKATEPRPRGRSPRRGRHAM